MKYRPSVHRFWSIVALSASTLALTACSAGSLGSSSGNNGETTLTFLVDNSEQSVTIAEQLITDFTAENPDIAIKVETRPQGTEGDNLVKTRLSTGDMSDIFAYNSGSLFQVLAPEKNLVSLTDESYVSQLDEDFKTSVTVDGQIYGVPLGTGTGGGILYNKIVYKKLGLDIPKTWDEFISNCDIIKAAGIVPVIQTYKDAWTSQVLVLADYHNVATADPDFATNLTANKVAFATSSAAIKSFEHLQEIYDSGYLNDDFASATLPDGLSKLGSGEGAQYPMLTYLVALMSEIAPDSADDIGFFALPGTSASSNGMTLWTPGAVYISQTTTGDRLAASMKFLSFIASPSGCASQETATSPTGPYMVAGCELPDDVPPVVTDMQSYLETPGTSTLALEFLSPIKGTSLEQIAVEVGSGIRSAADGAALYDQDIEKQAQQLGLDGW